MRANYIEGVPASAIRLKCVEMTTTTEMRGELTGHMYAIANTGNHVLKNVIWGRRRQLGSAWPMSSVTRCGCLSHHLRKRNSKNHNSLISLPSKQERFTTRTSRCNWRYAQKCSWWLWVNVVSRLEALQQYKTALKERDVASLLILLSENRWWFD